MELTEGKKRQLKISGILGTVVGVAMAAVMLVATNYNYVALVLIPIGIAIGLAQGYLSPASDEPERK